MIPVAFGDDFQRVQRFAILRRNQRRNHAGLVAFDDVLRYQLIEYPFEGTGEFSHGEIKASISTAY